MINWPTSTEVRWKVKKATSGRMSLFLQENLTAILEEI
jgi:hypothetical protein